MIKKFLFYLLLILKVRSKNTDFLCINRNNLTALYVISTRLFAFSFTPFLMMVLSTILISNHLINHKRKLQQNLVNYKREVEFIKSTLSMDLYFIISGSPLGILDFLQYVLNDKTKNSDVWSISRNIAIVLAYLDICCHFFVLILFNKLFRNKFKSIICCCKNQVSPLT